MSKETRIALLAIVAITILVLGYKFIIGKNVLAKNQYFYVKYKNIDQLLVSNPVMINGFQIGSVNDIYLDPADNTTPIVVLEVNEKIKIPKNATAELTSLGLMGGKAVQIKFVGTCTDCAKSGDYLEPASQSMLGSFVGEGEIEHYMDLIKSNANELFDSLSGPHGKKDIKAGVKNIEQTLVNLAQSTTLLNNLLVRNSNKLDKLVTNLESVIANIQASNNEIKNILKNVDGISTQVKQADVGKTMQEFNTTLVDSKKAIESLRKTMETADATLVSAKSILAKISKGEGTLGKLADDPKLYQNLANTSKQLELLLQDFRLNPKRYVNVSVFGKKQKDFVPVDQDPALRDSLNN